MDSDENTLYMNELSPLIKAIARKEGVSSDIRSMMEDLDGLRVRRPPFCALFVRRLCLTPSTFFGICSPRLLLIRPTPHKRNVSNSLRIVTT